MRYAAACTALLLLGLSACDMTVLEEEETGPVPVPVVASVEEHYDVALLLSTKKGMTSKELRKPGEGQVGTAINLAPGGEGRLMLYPDSAATLVVFLGQKAKATMRIHEEDTGSVVAETVAEGDKEGPVRAFLVVEHGRDGLTSRIERMQW